MCNKPNRKFMWLLLPIIYMAAYSYLFLGMTIGSKTVLLYFVLINASIFCELTEYSNGKLAHHKIGLKMYRSY